MRCRMQQTRMRWNTSVADDPQLYNVGRPRSRLEKAILRGRQGTDLGKRTVSLTGEVAVPLQVRVGGSM